ncbi:winged helix-turn-helix transcriptional regulator [Catenibacterium mitsuokai]|uniref:winged helix-turn-helix transcriptional regulator n=1 Tax=Catenibacterium mitsuokai TaxID=100886 RepID=UPI0022E653F7|nr:winged helix-turn-helix transcriptional regulator [Catenibacterium mitsuokai]
MERRRWIKLYMMDYDEVYHDSKMFHLWIDILLHTNPVDYYHHGDLIKRGQCILSLNQVAERCHMSKPTVSKYLRLLEECGKIKLDIQHKGTKVTVLNWDKYQSDTSTSGLELNQEVNHLLNHLLNQEVNHLLNPNKKSLKEESKRIKEETKRQTREDRIYNSLLSKGLEDYYSETYEKCEVYGFDRIKNLKAFCIAVAEELAAKKKPVPITEKKKPKVTQKVTEEDKEELRRLMEGLYGNDEEQVSDEEVAELRKSMEELGGGL